VLQTWRRNRRMSQLDLSSATGVTTRHISFVETGRSAPSRQMLDTLAAALDMPLRDRNDLYVAAGYTAPYRELGLDDEALADARAAIDRILESHEPMPAVVMDPQWNLLRTNRGAIELFGSMLDLGSLPQPANVLDLVFDHDGLRPFIAGWDAFARSLLERARREAVGGMPDGELADRLARFGAMLAPRETPSPRLLGPLVPIELVIGGRPRCYFSTVTTLGTPCDITLQELRIELFHPAGAD
jgi:transcriptional regulator with XRE-family HTH domain